MAGIRGLVIDDVHYVVWDDVKDANRFKEGISRDAILFGANMVGYEVWNLIEKLNCEGPAEGQDTAQGPEGR